MYAESTRPSAKREVQKERSAKRDNRIARPSRAQTCARSELRAKRAVRMCPLRGHIFFLADGLSEHVSARLQNLRRKFRKLL